MSARPRVAGLLQQALDHHRAGRYNAARACCRAVLSVAPDEADALHLLGLAAHRGGEHGEAVAYLERAVALRPEVAHFHANLGTAQLAAGAPAAAEPCLRAAVRLDPGRADAWSNLGLALLRQGRPADAEPCLVAALAAGGRADAAGDLAACRQQLGDAAAACGDLAAEAHYRAALAVRPDHAPSLTNLGNLLAAQARLDEAIPVLRAAVAVQPATADAHNNLAAALTASGNLAEAEGASLGALRLDPAHADAHYTLGTIRLLRGQLPEGFAGLEWRWRRRGFAAPRGFAVRQWDGARLAGRSVLLHAEQGLGDAIQMLRFVPLVAAGGRVLLELPAPLRRLAEHFAPVADISTAGESLPPFDLHCPLPSLPWALGLALPDIPSAPYLHPDPADEEVWQKRVDGLAGLRVGLCWAGNPGYAADARRSIPAERLAALADVPGITLVSLQVGTPPPDVPLHDWSADLTDLADTAALIAALDLVISVDTAVAHLAGALGRPVWLLNRFDTCWRWMLGRDDSPWYPTLRIIRQERPGDWDGVLARVRDGLARGDRLSAIGEPAI